MLRDWLPNILSAIVVALIWGTAISAGGSSLQVTIAAIAACMTGMWRVDTTAKRALWFNLAFVIGAVGLFGSYLDHKDQGDLYREEISGDPIWIPDPEMSYRNAPGASATAARYFGEELIYKATYTIDQDGLRRETTAPTEPDRPCVLFFGCSFAFGEGLADHETLANQVAARANGRLTVRNFGVPGYGPHHMLAAIDSGFVERAVDCSVTHVIFEAIGDHVARAAGAPVAEGDPTGPRFVLEEDDTLERDAALVRRGNFGDASWGPSQLANSFRRTPFGRAIQRRAGRNLGNRDIETFAAIVATSRDRLQALYPNSRFDLVFRDRYDPTEFVNALATHNINVHRVRDIFPEREDWAGHYELRHDGHPTALANGLLATYLLEQVIGRGH